MGNSEQRIEREFPTAAARPTPSPLAPSRGTGRGRKGGRAFNGRGVAPIFCVMFPDRPVIAIVGAGAVGGYYGARLAQHGHDVHFLLRGDYGAVKRNGLVVQSCDGDFTLPPPSLNVYDDPHRMPKADLVIVTLKSTANEQFARLIPPL